MRRSVAYVATLVVALAISVPGASRARAQAQNPTSGRDIFRVRCAMCHGSEGRGDGPAGAALNPRPTNFWDAAQRTARTDSAVADVIARGRRAMPAFGRMLSRAQVDSVVAFLRTMHR